MKSVCVCVFVCFTAFEEVRSAVRECSALHWELLALEHISASQIWLLQMSYFFAFCCCGSSSSSVSFTFPFPSSQIVLLFCCWIDKCADSGDGCNFSKRANQLRESEAAVFAWLKEEFHLVVFMSVLQIFVFCFASLECADSSFSTLLLGCFSPDHSSRNINVCVCVTAIWEIRKWRSLSNWKAKDTCTLLHYMSKINKKNKK